MKRRSFFHYFLKSSAGILTSRLLGLIRDLVVAAVFGANKVTDAFFVAFAVPNLFRALFAEGALSSAYIPVLADKYKHDKDVAIRYVNQLIVVISTIILFLIGIIYVFPEFILGLFMPGNVDDKYLMGLGAIMLAIVMPYLLFVTAVAILTGYLNLLGSYYIPYSSTAMLNIFMILGAVAGYYNGCNILYLAWGVFLGGVFQFVYVFLYSFKKDFRLVRFGDNDPDLKKTFLLILPSIAGLGISQINFVVDRIFASFLSSGSISFLYYANRLFQFPLGVFSVALSSVSLTEMSKALADGDNKRAYKIIDKSIISLCFIVIPATVGLMSLSYEISALIYKRKSFGEMETIYTSEALKMYAVGLLFYSLVGLFTRVYYSKKDTKTPVKIAFFMMFLNALLNYLLMMKYKHAGIALSSSIVAMVNAFLLYKMIDGYVFSFKVYGGILIRIFLSSVLMYLMIILFRYFHVHVLITVVISGACYFLFIRLSGLKIMEVLR
ncbi:MAG: murein biosynthesis integral membrane protein MurJ [Calditerrivibrio sp.]|nr:murein biosynthesis integral membrane protein MurJ [Calditerrivibrio sp.]